MIATLKHIHPCLCPTCGFLEESHTGRTEPRRRKGGKSGLGGGNKKIYIYIFKVMGKEKVGERKKEGEREKVWGRREKCGGEEGKM